MKGRVIYSYAGNYRVYVNNKIYDAKPLGIFRKTKTRIVVGDLVELNLSNKKNELNTITKLFDRKNFFIRPLISNIDQALLVTSVLEPDFNDYLLDKFITIFQINDIKPILIFTKYDLTKSISTDLLRQIDQKILVYQKLGYDVIIFENKLSPLNLKKFKDIIKNKFSVITGQTGVGKSTFLNFIDNDLELKVDNISKALGRGKHTTRHSEAYEIYKNSFIVDTPGFSSLELNTTQEQLSKNFLNFFTISQKCKFRNCLHIDEKECNVKQNTDNLKYNNYLKLIKELKEK